MDTTDITFAISELPGLYAAKSFIETRINQIQEQIKDSRYANPDAPRKLRRNLSEEVKENRRRNLMEARKKRWAMKHGEEEPVKA